LGDANAIARRDGFFAVVDQHPDLIEVVSRIPTDWNTDTAYAGLTNAFQSHPDINFLFTSADFLLPQIVEVMKKADKFHPIEHPDHVVFGGFDGDEMAYKLLRDQYLDADGVQDLEYEAKLCVDSLVDMAAGKLGPQAGATNPLILNDPGFAIHQGNLEHMQARMWGYQLHLQKSLRESDGPAG
jgi:ABC-type sugar transport system substrate-binding protein